MCYGRLRRPASNGMRFRLFIVLLFFIFLYSSLILNIYNLQIEKGVFYAVRAESQSRLAGFLKAKRGNIYFTDKNGSLVPAVINKEFPVIFAIPKEISDPEGTANQLALILGLDEDKLFTTLAKPSDPYEPILKRVASKQAEAVKQAKLTGIYVEKEGFRFYPFNNLASQVLGFLAPTAEDPTLSGKYGVEEYFNQELSGRDGQLEGDKIVDPEDGQDIILTIDPNIQTRAEDILINLIKKYKAEGGTVIVQDPKTGKILALGNYPAFDPNHYSEYKLKNFLNPALQAVYEPGSVFKIFTMSAGIDSNKITPETTFVDSGSVTLNGYTIKNWDEKAHGKVTMTEVIEKSINTGAVYAVQKTGKDIFYKYLKYFGFSEATNINLPGEIVGDLRNLKTSFREINFATASFGQGVAVTPIELISAVAAIANKGVLTKPYITVDTEPAVRRRVISEATANKVINMMTSAVRKAYIAQIPKYDVAGKTGTAQVPDLQNGGYLEEYIHTFVGFAPAFDARFVILIKLDKPSGAPLAGLTVVPAFRELAEFVLNYYNVPPDYFD